ncbi:3558_t:CDS:2 [Funneliformis mosseae]|uniref:3558_t:CDS:1 n=1 Tax=Funneliformis mosseae TaxID=27381 RepID=A0A9N9GCG6_FUNMO|nr:3558_t:CDS:2 [Funneliformis mosseae]
MKVPRKNKEQKEYFKQKSVVENTHLSTNSWLKNSKIIAKQLDWLQFPDLHLILDGKLKELAEVDFAISYTYSRNAIKTLKRIFFYNAIFLGLRGGEHYKLKFSHFHKKYDGGYDVNITRSKIKQGGIEDPNNGSDDKLQIPDHPSIIADYDLFFIKCPVDVKENFYLQEITNENGKLQLQEFLHNLAVECGISVEGRKITNHSGCKSLVSLLKELNFTDI